MDNKDYWVARCDLLEKTKLRFDQDGIRFAYPQLDLHLIDTGLQPTIPVAYTSMMRLRDRGLPSLKKKSYEVNQ